MEDNGGKSFTILNFRENRLEFRPCAHLVRFILPDDKSKKPYVTMRYPDSSAEKLFWISHYINIPEQATIVLHPECGNIFRGDFRIEIPVFPVTDFAKNFRLVRILEKGIKEMRATVLSLFDIQIMSSKFFDHFLNGGCEVQIECESPQMEQAMGYTFPVILNAKVVNPIVN